MVLAIVVYIIPYLIGTVNCADFSPHIQLLGDVKIQGRIR